MSGYRIINLRCEVNGKIYEATHSPVPRSEEQSDGDDDSGIYCTGCAAAGDGNLCDTLPNCSDVLNDLIYVEVPNEQA